MNVFQLGIRDSLCCRKTVINIIIKVIKFPIIYKNFFNIIIFSRLKTIPLYSYYIKIPLKHILYNYFVLILFFRTNLYFLLVLCVLIKLHSNFENNNCFPYNDISI